MKRRLGPSTYCDKRFLKNIFFVINFSILQNQINEKKIRPLNLLWQKILNKRISQKLFFVIRFIAHYKLP